MSTAALPPKVRGASYEKAATKAQETAINGYVIVQDAGGLISRITEHDVTRARLIQKLLTVTPESCHILGIVLDPAASERALRLVA